MAAPAAVLSVLVTASTGGASAQLTRLDRQLKGTAATANTSGQRIATGLKVGALAVGAATKLAYDFENSMSKVRSLVGASQKQTDQWSKQLLNLSPKIGKSPKELADALYYVSSSGIKASKVMGTVKVAAQASALGLGQSEQVADALTSAMNAYAKSGLTARDATNVLIKTVKVGKLEADELAGSIGRVIPVSSQLGVSFNDVGAALGAMSLQGLDAAEATTALRGIFTSFIKPTAESEAALQSVGLSAAQLRDELDKKGTLATLSTLSEAFQGNVEEMGKVFPNVRALVGAFNLTGENAKTNADIFRQLGADTDDLGKSWGEFSQTPAQKLRSAMAGIQTELTKIGIQILPVVADEFKKFADILGDKSLTTDQKIAKIGEQLTQAAEKWGPKLAEAGGKLGLALIKGIADAFWHSDILGKLFIGAGAIRLFGGPGVFGKLGVAIFTRIFGSSAATSAATTAASSTVGTALNGAGPASKIGGKTLGRLAGAGIVLGLALEAPAIAEQVQKIVGGVPLQDTNRESFAAKIEEYFGADEGSAKFLGRFKVKLQTEVGNLIFDSRTQKVVAAKGKQLKSAVGETYGQAFQVVANAKREIPFDALVQGFAKVGQKARSTKKPIADYFNELVGDFKLANRGVSTHQTTLSRAMSAISGDLGAGKSDLQGYISGLSQSFGKGKDKTKDFRDSTGGNITGLSNIFGSAVGAIITNLNNSLGKLGAGSSKINWKAVSADPNGRSLGRQRGGLVPGFAKGAIVPGSGSGDTVPLHLGGQLAAWVEPGEYVSVANRKATAALMARNKEIPRFAEGGVIQQALGPYTIPPVQYDPNHAGSNSHLHLDFFTVAQALAYGHKMQGMGWNISEYTPKGGNPWGFGPITTQHQSPGHYDGTAFDANTAADETRAEVEAVVRMLGGSAKGLGAAVEQLKKVTLSGPDGPLKEMGQAALDKTLKAANAYLQKHTPTDGGGAVSYMAGGDGSVPIQIGKILTRQGFERAGAAGIIGNAYAESTWNPAAMEPHTDNGGLWGFTSGEKSLAGLRAYAAKLHKPWTDVGAQTAYMLGTVDGDLKEGLNRLDSPEAAAELFMNVWERPGDPRLDVRQKGARMAYGMKGWQRGGIVAKLQKGGFLDPFIDRIYNAKATKKQSVQEIRKLTAKAAKHKIAKLATQGLSFDKNSEIAGKLAKLREQADTFGEYASNASNGTFRGKTEAEWTTMELDALWAFRQTLAKVEEKVKERREQAEKIAKRAQKLLKQWDDKLASAKDRLAREGETPRGWKGDDPSKVSVEKWNKLGGGKRLATMRKFLAAGGKLPGDRKFLEDGSIATPDSQPDMFPNTKGMSAVSSLLKGTVIPGLVGSGGVIAALSGDIKELASRFDTVQGKGLTHRFLDGLPEFGSADALGGEIFTAQQRLAELGKSTTSDANPLDITGIRDIVEAARYGTFDYQLDPTFAGMFAKGGAIPSGKWGIAGEAGPEIIHGPATVTPAAGGVSIENNVYLDGLDLIIDTRIDGKLAKHERKAWLAEKAGR